MREAHSQGSIISDRHAATKGQSLFIDAGRKQLLLIRSLSRLCYLTLCDVERLPFGRAQQRRLDEVTNDLHKVFDHLETDGHGRSWHGSPPSKLVQNVEERGKVKNG